MERKKLNFVFDTIYELAESLLLCETKGDAIDFLRSFKIHIILNDLNIELLSEQLLNVKVVLEIEEFMKINTVFIDHLTVLNKNNIWTFLSEWVKFLKPEIEELGKEYVKQRKKELSKEAIKYLANSLELKKEENYFEEKMIVEKKIKKKVSKYDFTTLTEDLTDEEIDELFRRGFGP